jgi:hypothetical protein
MAALPRRPRQSEGKLQQDAEFFISQRLASASTDFMYLDFPPVSLSVRLQRFLLVLGIVTAHQGMPVPASLGYPKTLMPEFFR